MPFEIPASYFPFQSGKYEVTPGLRKFWVDHGNGINDQRVFQLDHQFEKYRKNKILCAQERIGKYFQEKDCDEPVQKGITQWWVDRAIQDHPDFFVLEKKAQSIRLTCSHTGEVLEWDLDWNWKGSEGCPVQYSTGLFALSMQMQEDFAIWRRIKTQSKEWLSWVHLSAPNHWSPEEKIGRTFSEVHLPVAGFARANPLPLAIVDAIITKGPMLRFAWGVATDQRLNHHPVAPLPKDWESFGVQAGDSWVGRAFQKEKPELYVRVERQTLWSFPALEAALFTIRTYFIDGVLLKQQPALRDSFISAIRSMSPESLVYKGLDQNRDLILDWLAQA